MQKNQLSLEEVKSHFDQWRATRIKRGKIPVHLWNMVKQIVSRYSLTAITKALSINSYQLASSIDDNPTINFVKVRTDITPLLPTQASKLPSNDLQICSIELHRVNGVLLKINALPVTSLTAIITQFMG